MFKQFRNIESSFKYIKTFSMLVVAFCMLFSSFAVYKSFEAASVAQSRIYILANGKALEAYAADRKDNIPVEARDHVKMFHLYFFTLDPDDKVIQTNIAKALYMADASAKRQYDDLKEGGYYANLIAGNMSQELTVDSVQVDLQNYPYYFRCYATEKITRTTSIVTRDLVTEGYLRNVSRSDNNPHGFLIERWNIIENKDIKTQSR
ncbi:MAG TPA: conjugative transposon protein TraK [Chitinophagaceae bacterium]|nr:conjugative transposon protein TraK [Chitinophagaceae bacterium]